MSEYQSKLCPRLTAGMMAVVGHQEAGLNRATVGCQEDACQLWWQCREPEAEDVRYVRELNRMVNGPVPQAEAKMAQGCADLEAMATGLVCDIEVLMGRLFLTKWRRRAEALAISVLQEARDGR